MKKLFIVANWKSNKTRFESIKWIQEFSREAGSSFAGQISNEKEVVICSSFISLSAVSGEIKNSKLEFKMGVQDISPFDEGPYTGEVNAKQAGEFARYAIIGHSERRENFNETDEIINQKIEMAIKHELTPILCVSELHQIQNSKFKIQNYPAELDQASRDNSKLKSEGKQFIIAFEPLFAVGTGQTDTPENASKMAKNIKQQLGEVFVLYGGSVKSGNVNEFTRMENIDGVLVGNASLDPLEFLNLVKNA